MDERGAPLHWAAINNDLEMARLLLERGASAHTVRDASGNALNRAISHENEALENLLLRHGAVPGYGEEVSPGFYASNSDNITVDSTLLKSNPNCVKEVLNGALLGGHPDLVALCMSMGETYSENRCIA